MYNTVKSVKKELKKYGIEIENLENNNDVVSFEFLNKNYKLTPPKLGSTYRFVITDKTTGKRKIPQLNVNTWVGFGLNNTLETQEEKNYKVISNTLRDNYISGKIISNINSVYDIELYSEVDRYSSWTTDRQILIKYNNLSLFSMGITEEDSSGKLRLSYDGVTTEIEFDDMSSFYMNIDVVYQMLIEPVMEERISLIKSKSSFKEKIKDIKGNIENGNFQRQLKIQTML